MRRVIRFIGSITYWRRWITGETTQTLINRESSQKRVSQKLPEPLSVDLIGDWKHAETYKSNVDVPEEDDGKYGLCFCSAQITYFMLHKIWSSLKPISFWINDTVRFACTWHVSRSQPSNFWRGCTCGIPGRDTNLLLYIKIRYKQ